LLRLYYMEESRFRQLLHLLKENRLADSEWLELLGGIDEGKFDELLSADILSLLEEREPTKHWTTRREEKIFEKIKLATGLSSEPLAIKRRYWIRYAAAASVLLMISLGGYFLFFKKQPSQIAAIEKTAEKNDIAPGTHRAILFLANGTKIDLDSASNGRLAQLGNITVTKTDNGKLLYASAKVRTADENGMNELRTPRGGIYQITLPDGTSAWLNAASSIMYPTHFTGKQRQVKVTGEVYFEVAHDEVHPFVVSANETKVEVLGTHFNINLYGDEPEDKITLIEGSVKVSTSAGTVRLAPDEQALITGHKITLNKKADLEKVMAWKNGEMVLSHGSVARLMQDISRWYDVDVQYKGIVPDGKFSGSIDRNVPLSSLLNVLHAYGIETKMAGKKIIVQ